MVIFLNAHGHENGSFCYESKNSCSFTANNMLDIINSLDELNKNILSRRIKTLLIIPTFCYNQVFAQDFFEKLDKKSYKSFAIIMPHLRFKGPEFCSNYSSINHFLFQQQIRYIEYTTKAFKKWASAHNRISRILAINTLSDFISLSQEVLENNEPTSAHKMQTIITSFAKNKNDEIINLRDFELSPIFVYQQDSAGATGVRVVNQKFIASPREIAHNALGNIQLENAVLEVILEKKSYYNYSPPYDTAQRWDEDALLEITIKTN